MKHTISAFLASVGGYRDFLQEGLCMENFNHPHVMSLLGISFTEEVDQPINGVEMITQKPMIITAFMEKGNLENYLKNGNNVGSINIFR